VAAVKPELQLRPVTDDDLPTLFHQQLDPEASRMAAFPPRDHMEFAIHAAKLMVDPTVIWRAIAVGRELAGYVGSWTGAEGRLVGYWLGREHWGRGIATGALTLFLAEHERARPLHAHVAKHNGASLRVLEKCGFRVLREERAVVRGEEADESVLLLGPP
jgi:RimJ/RimL family protein N-acetyltransferase